MSETLGKSRSMGFDEDSLLVDRFVAGDEEAFVDLYRKHYPKVLALAQGVLLSRDEAEDAAQEVFSLVLRKLADFDQRSRFSTWLYRVTINRSIQYARSTKHRKGEFPIEAGHEVAAPVSPMSDPTVNEAMKRLSPNDRAILTLFYWEELSLEELGESLDCSTNAAKTRLFRARERFRVIFEELNP